MSYILLTRPLDDTIELGNALQLPILKAPLLDVELVIPENEVVADDYNNLIVTSARSLKIFASVNDFLKKPIWCVGAKTARLAKELGFEIIYAAENSAMELCQLILSKTSPQTEKFLHICGECLHYDITKKLCEAGYQANKMVLYKTIPIERFEADIVNAFLNHHIVMIPIFSHKTAETLANVVRYHKLESHLKNITLVVCAQQNAIPLQQFNWQEILVMPDLFVSTLSILYHQVIAKRERTMSLKTFSPWLVITALISIFLSLTGSILGGKYLLKSSTLINIQEIQETVKTSLQAFKIGQNATKNDVKINELITKVTSLKKQFEAFKKRQSSLSEQSLNNLYLKAYVMVVDVQEQLNAGNVDQSTWQEMTKLLQDSKVRLPENLLNLKKMPVSKKELLQQLKNANQSDPSQVVTQNISTKLIPEWLNRMLEQVEVYIGKIVINKTENLSLPTQNVQATRDNLFDAVNNDDDVQLKLLIEKSETSKDNKVILINAQKRLQILQGLKELKPLLWQLSKKNKE